MEKNDLKGLDLNGFSNQTRKFDSSDFKEKEKIEKLRYEIRKYLTKIKNFNKSRTSYGLKHELERHIEEYVSNGELIYAMHLEGFKIRREGINCIFNFSTTSLRHLINSNSIKSALKTPFDYEISDYLKFQKKFQKNKYHFKLIIRNIFSDARELKKDIPHIIAKEINETPENIKLWFDLDKDRSETIPNEKLELISKQFNLLPNDLKNY